MEDFRGVTWSHCEETKEHGGESRKINEDIRRATLKPFVGPSVEPLVELSRCQLLRHCGAFMEPFMLDSSWKIHGAKRGAVVDLEKLLKEPSRSFCKAVVELL